MLDPSKLNRPSKSFPPGPQKWAVLLGADPFFLIAWLFTAIAEGIAKGIMKARFERKAQEDEAAQKLADEIEKQAQTRQKPDTGRHKRPKR